MSLPNSITLIRILIVPFFFTQLVSIQSGDEKARLIALILFIVACITDALDGFLARILNQKTQLGQFLDPFADKLLILSGFLGLLFVPNITYHPPLWITVSIVFRDFVIVSGLVVIFLLKGTVDAKPNFLGKLCTFFQMATLCTILLKSKVAIPLSYLTAFITILSCVVYARREIRKLEKTS